MACSKKKHRWLVIAFEDHPQRRVGYKCAECGAEKEVLVEKKQKAAMAAQVTV